MSREIVAVSVVVVGMLVAGAAAAQQAAGRGGKDREITISDGKSLVWCSSAGKGTLVSISRGEEGTNLIAPEGDLWSVELEQGSLRSSQADSFSVQGDTQEKVLAWRFETNKLTVRVRVKALPDAQGMAMEWSAQCEAAEGIRVREIHFPTLRAAATVASVTNPGIGRSVVLKAVGRYGGLYPGTAAAVQFFAAYTGGGEGFYLGAHDGQGYTKTLVWDHGKVTFTFHQPDPQEPRKQVAVPYPIVLGTFKGDWQDGADYYRKWAWQAAPWCKRGTLAQIGPEWARRSTAWFYWLARFPVPLADLAPRVRNVFGIKGPIAVHALDPGTQDHSNMPTAKPEDWVLRLKRRQLPMLRKHGFYVFEYRNAHKYTKGFRGYEQALPFAMGWNGKLHDEGPYAGGPNFHSRWVPPGTPGSKTWGVGEDAYGEMPLSQKYPLTEMCIGTSYWQNKLVEMVTSCPSHGLIGNYLDQIGYNPNSSRCDAPDHGHPLRGGNWYVRGHEEALRRIILVYQKAGVEHPLLSHEFFSEPLVGLLNTALCNWDIRLLSYLYHPYIIFESHNIYGWGNPDLARLREEVAHDFHSGRMPGLTVPCSLPGVDLTAILRDRNNSADAPALRMMRHWFGVRAAWLEHLNLGTMLHTPKLSPESGRIMTSAWRNPSGDVALFFSNATGKSQKLVFDPASFPLRAHWRAWKNDRQEVKELADWNEGAVRLELAPDETLILEAPAGSTGP